MPNFIRMTSFYRYFIALYVCFLSINVMAIEWPQEVDTAEGTIVVYQPQPESLKGNILSARSAMSFTPKDQDAIFGVFWFTAKIDTDRSTDQATVRDLNVNKVRWPESKDAGEQRFTVAVNNALKASSLEISLSQLTASLESAEAAQKSLTQIKNDPPKIVFEEQLAVLLSFDGEVKYGAIDNSPYERALNTTMTVVRDTKSNVVYLTTGFVWYQAEKVEGPYTVTTTPPADLVKIVPKPEGDAPKSKDAVKIVVATEPTELIATQGTANWKSLSGGELIYVNNTETPWLRELSTSNMYVLLSGRWFRAKQQSGPWTFVRADELPASFANIPPASDLGGLRVSVAGTEEANEATLDAQVPQTAAISRKDTSLTVNYDGDPQFESIPGTAISYAVNTASQVIMVNRKYYAVDNAVWFTADSAMGPWTVADDIPDDEIAKIPPSSPVYNIIYVDIYESTPEVVYVGYYPGYMWSYSYYGVPVYGTGWYYRPYWRGGYYYPRPPTWGLHVGYHNGSGWNYGVSWSRGFYSVGVSWNAGYRGPRHPPHCCHGGGHNGPVFVNNGNINIGNKVNIGNNKHENGKLTRDKQTKNLYKRGENSKRNATAGQVKRNVNVARGNKELSNNVFADKEGNVLKQNGDKWQQRDQGKWKNVDNSKVTTQKAANQQVKARKETTKKPTTQQGNVSNTNREKVSTHTQTKPPSSQQRKPSNNRVQQAPQHRQQSMNNASRARQQGAHRQQTRQVSRSVPHRGR